MAETKTSTPRRRSKLPRREKAKEHDILMREIGRVSKKIDDLFDPNVSGGGKRTLGNYHFLLSEIHGLLTFMDFPGVAKYELSNYLDGLYRFDLGDPPRFLKPTRAPLKGKPGPRPPDQDQWRARASLLFAMQYLKATNECSVEYCAARVAEMFQFGEILVAPKSDDFTSTLRDWFNDKESQKENNPLFRKEMDDYEVFVEIAKANCESKNSKSSEEDILEELLSFAIRFAKDSAPPSRIKEYNNESDKL